MEYLSVDVHNLDCIDLEGLRLGIEGKQDSLTSKLLAHSNDQPLGRVALRENPLETSRYLLLDGRHRSFASYVFKRRVSGVLYDTQEEIGHPLTRENFGRALMYHETASILGRGTVAELMDEVSFRQYLKHLQRLKSSNQKIEQVIEALQRFWNRISNQ